MLSFFHFIFSFFVKNQEFIDVLLNIQVFYSVPLVLLSVLMPIPGYIQYCSSVVEFEVWDFFFLKNSSRLLSKTAFITKHKLSRKYFCLLSNKVNSFFSRPHLPVCSVCCHVGLNQHFYQASSKLQRKERTTS